MRIKGNKNLKYEKPWFEVENEFIDPKFCLLEKWSRPNDKLALFFKNKSHSVIRTRNEAGVKDIDLIEKNLDDFVGKNYEEILEAEF